jgi:hypothetical protein
MQWVVEDCLVLDANRLAKMGVFSEGRRSSAKWESGANVGLVYSNGAMELLYNLEGESNNQTVRIAKVPCHFGGARYYMHCPGCNARRYKLHLAHSGFYCRDCYRLPYYSQECGYLDGVIRKIHKLEAKLERLPKHARQKTVDRLEGKLARAEREWAGAIISRFGGLEAMRFGLLE